MAEEFDPLETPEQRIDRLATQPLITTGRRPSPEAVAEAKRIAALAAPAEADPEEEPPMLPGKPLTFAVEEVAHGHRFFPGVIPPDLAAVWCRTTPMDEMTARVLIEAWGLDGFRGSALHLTAVQDLAAQAGRAEVQTRFKAEREKKGKKGR